jgi:ERCC4-type nuclease
MLTAILIDQREPDWVKRLTFKNIPAPIPTTVLEVGDAWLACDDGAILIVERKTPDDFLGSLADERLFSQVERLVTQYALHGWLPYLVISGNFLHGPNRRTITARGETGWNWHAVQGALLSIQEAGVPVTFCAGDDDYGACLERLGNRERKPIRSAPLRGIVPLTIQEQILVSLPGIGPEKAAALLNESTSVAWALDLLTDLHGPKISLIGDGTRKNVRFALGLENGNRLAVVATE